MTEFRNHVEMGKTIGNRVARRAVLAVNVRNTSDELEDMVARHRDGRGWDKFSARDAMELAETLKKGERRLEKCEAVMCRKLAVTFDRQIVDSVHLAAVLGNHDEPGELSDTYSDASSEDDEDEGDAGSLDDFIEKDEKPRPSARAVRRQADVVAPSAPLHRSAPALNHLFERRFGGRTMLRKVYSLFRELADEFKGDARRIAQEMAACQGVDEYTVHVALTQIREPATAVGQRVAVAFDADGVFHAGRVVQINGVTEPDAPVGFSAFVVVEFDDGERLTLDPVQLIWHYVCE